MSVPIAQWIVHISPEDGMAVRFRLGIKRFFLPIRCYKIIIKKKAKQVNILMYETIALFYARHSKRRQLRVEQI